MKNMKLILARTERDMTQSELAAAVGITRQTVSLIEKLRESADLGGKIIKL